MSINVIIITNSEFEEPEVIYPYYRLKSAGFNVDIATINGYDVKGKWGYPISAMIKPNVPLDIFSLKSNNFDLVVIPGGLLPPDKLRQDKATLDFIVDMHSQNKIVASICHGPWVLVSAGILKGVKATCYPSMIDDLNNCGAKYIDSSVVIDKNIVTSRRPSDLPQFVDAIISLLIK
jgi:protease I